MSAQKPSRDTANLWVYVPFVAAVIGTVVMLFTNSANALKVALIFALWAGAAGILLNSKVRRDRDAAEDEARAAEQRAREQEERHRAELQAAPAAPAAPAVDVEALRELQDQIQALRNQLEELSGRVFEYEPAAVRASARRISELEAVQEPKQEPAPAPEPAPEPEPAQPEPKPATESAPAPKPGPSSDDTVVITRVRPARPTGAPSSDAIAGRIGAQPSSRPALNPLSDLISEREAEKNRAPESAPAPEPAQAHGEHEAPDAPRSGRRRRDERGETSVSVAELLARQGK